jgi:hypothetical protein
VRKTIVFCLNYAALLLLLLSAQAALAGSISPDGIWDEVDSATIMRTVAARQITPQRFRTLQINRQLLEQTLQATPMEREQAVQQSNSSLWLPLPDGGFGEFRIVESPIMEPELAQRFPQIRTWLGQGIDDPMATLRFDLTPKGFHAQIISAHGTYYIDPYQPGDVDNYIAYAKHHLDRGERLRCEVTGEELTDDHMHLHDHSGDVRLSSGANLRTYRLALAVTGEYTIFHGGTVADGLAGIVTTMNRVNGIYEREISVRMVLVANNDAIIYTDPATDPYTNSSASSQLAVNQTNIDAVIGIPNYDIGHLFVTSGGGVASLRSVCGTGKALGLTGLPSPIGDPFNVDYVAHEIGHQFGGNHTFNGSGSACSGANRNPSTAYEPGSGVTILAYAGICGGDNLQPNSEDYFHRASLNEMIAFTNNPSTGGSCGTLSATGNAVPTVTTTAAVTIPQQTPFELDAIGSDADGDELTYLWEQFDLGNRNTTGSLTDNGGPLFRSFTPRFESSRTFPSLRYILNNANVAPNPAPLPGTTTPNYFTAELLPNTDRTMNFRVTVRDNRAGGGGTNEAAAAVTVTSSAGPFVVTAPNTAVTWEAGTQQTVTWNVAGTDAGTVNTANVRIRLSLDGGYTWPLELASSTPNNGSAMVTIPADTPATNQARVRVEAVGSVWFDVSDVNFSVSSGSNTPPLVWVVDDVSTRQGSPTASEVVAAVSDNQDEDGTLTVSVSEAPPELEVEVSNSDGAVTLEATASCTLSAPLNGTRTYPVLLQANDSEGASGSAYVNVRVGSNLKPTLGNYANLDIERGTAGNNPPSAAPADGNNNLAGMTVTPATLPGGGSLSVALPSGTVSIQTNGATTPGTYPVRVQVIDSCGATEARDFLLTVDNTVVVGVNIVESGGATSVTEGGASDSYSVVLTSQPDANVQIALSPDTNLAVDASSLTFTPASWNVAQTVTVTAVDDRIVQGTHTGTITHTATGGGYTGIAIADVVATITDNDFATYQFSTAASSADEADGSALIEVAMTFDVIGSGDIALASPISVPFTVAAGSSAVEGIDYSLPASNVLIPVDGSSQAITVILLDNAIVDGNRTLVLDLGTATGDGAMQDAVIPGLPASHTLTIVDNDLTADIAVSNLLLTTTVLAGQPIAFEVTISNLDTTVDVPVVAFEFSVLPALDNLQWTCTASAGATCPASGSGMPVHDIALARESSVLYSIIAEVPADSLVGTAYEATATVQAAPPIDDPNPANDSDTATATVTTIEVFRDRFEASPF